ncbi:transcription initiation factor IIB family protein [Halomarina oriensis]|uniref:Transcription initiation factor IIB family protein n=1 Tax=Halomarina oriensis TaxID=671145 RepID=A0A6B0GMC4_9EURY|nr:transcription initiation factor IIB family protein [Halomarina oriensis]MWG33893.1 transcription initiation factor IIB family protein [Halomarina oriensis]
MYRARDYVENERWLADLDAAGDRLGLESAARSRAVDLFLSTVPDEERSKQASMAAALYVGALIEGDRRSQGAVADAVGVSRLSVQQNWKDLIEEAGLRKPSW